jgi:hypothetical protein
MVSDQSASLVTSTLQGSHLKLSAPELLFSAARRLARRVCRPHFRHLGGTFAIALLYDVDGCELN